MASKRKRSRNSGLAALGLTSLMAASCVLGASTAAAAADGNIDPTKPLTLTIHKYEQPANNGARTNGTQLDPSQTASLTPMPGVAFTATPVTAYDGETIDLSAATGWASIPDEATFDRALATLGTPVAATTDSTGTAAFGTLPTALYLVEQGAAPGHNVVKAMEPFLVTLPLSGPDGGGWVYDVHAYPKSSVTTAEKSVDDSDAHGLGDTIDWSIVGKVPFLGGADLTTFTVVDTLPAQVSYVGATVEATNSAGATVALAASDYTLSHTGQTVSLTLSSTGLDKLEAAGGGEVELNVETKVDSIGTGTIENTAVVTINDAVINVDAATTWGAAKIDKNAEGTDKGLAGAEFQVFASAADAAAKQNPITVGGVSTFVTSEADGEVLISGLKAAQTGTTYWVVETKAPNGYLLDSTPIELVVLPSDVTNPVELDVENRQSPTSMIPVLGATGGQVMGVWTAGGLLLAGAMFLALSKRRRKAEADA